MAPYWFVFQLLALVQWRARAQAHYACTQLPSVSHSGRQAELDWQWIRVCPADSGADMCDCQWPSPGHNAASLQQPSGQLGLNDCICASDGQLFISSNLKLRPTWKFPPSTWNLAAATATSPCAGSRPSPCSWTTVPIDSPLTPGGGGAPGGWRPQVGAPTRAIPLRRCHDISWNPWYHMAMISGHTDIRGPYHGLYALMSWDISKDTDIIADSVRYVYDIVGNITKKIAQGMGKWLWYCQKRMRSYMIS
jgi:hypothetical protein